MAALPASAPVEKLVCTGQFCGRQPDAGHADLRYRSAWGSSVRTRVGPNVIVNGTSCKRVDGVTEIPLDALTACSPRPFMFW